MDNMNEKENVTIEKKDDVWKKYGLGVCLLCLIIVMWVADCTIVKKPWEAPASVTAPAAVTAAPADNADADEGITMHLVDYDKLYASHAPEEIVMSIDGEDISWDEYFTFMFNSASEVENYMQTMALNYGQEVKWDDMVDENSTFAEYVKESAAGSIVNLIAIEKNAENLGFEADAEFDKVLEEQRQSDIVTVLGEGGTEEAFFETLRQAYMSPAAYERMNHANATYSQAFTMKFGENLEKVDEQIVLDLLNEAGYMNANHILFMTVDRTTNEPLDDAAIEEKLAQANKLVEELSAISDPEERVARFKELKEQYDEDTGKVAYPDGYVFTPGQMVPEFEEAARTQTPYEIYDPVKTTYGYHIVMALPVTADTVLGNSNDGTPYTARIAYASNDYGGGIARVITELTAEYAEGFEMPNFADFEA